MVRLDPGLPVPRRAHPDDAGLDLCAATDVELAPGEREQVTELVRREMGAAFELDVPLEVSVGFGRSWDQAAH